MLKFIARLYVKTFSEYDTMSKTSSVRLSLVAPDVRNWNTGLERAGRD